MMRAKAAAAFVSGILAVSLAGCSSGTADNNNSSATQADSAEEQQATASAPQQDASEPSEPHVKESGWSYSDSGYIRFCAIVSNPDPVNCYVGMPLNVTARSENGTVLANSTFYAAWVAPNDVMPVGGILSDLQEKPYEVTVDFSFKDGSKPGNDYTLADLPVSGVTDTGKKVTGEFTNGTGCDFDRGVSVFAVFRSGGEIVGYSQSIDYSNPCPDGKKSAFEISYAFDGIPEHDAVDVYAIPNLISPWPAARARAA